jgi:maltose alpha-D-glucosyltransferase/alpha-amylase
MGRYLTRLGYANAPLMLGEVTRFGNDGTQYTMIMLQQYIDNQGDAWQWTLDTLSLSIQRATVTEPAAGTEPTREISDPEEDLTRLSTMLGRRLGEMHAALATPTDDPDFSPQSVTAEDASTWAAGARAQVEAAFEVLRSKTEWTSSVEKQRIAQLIEQREQLLDNIEGLAAAAVGTLRIRVHGDFHLGQVLVAHGDVYIVDFEGEPAKPLEQRRAKSSPLRDVAGLLRSLDYAAAFASKVGPGDLSETEELRKQHIIRTFVPRSQAAFLRAYREALYAGPLAYSDEAERALLNMFLLEKAAYEVCYEANNRPDWIPVPANGMAKIAARLLGMAEGEPSND